MGRVYAAVHVATGTPVAVKVLSCVAAEDETYRVAFRHEVRAVAGLDHPNIVAVLDHGEIGPEASAATRGELAPGLPWLAMELAGGGTLTDRVKALEWRAFRRILLDLLDGLAHAHARGVIHRDIKPGNVLFSGPRGRVLLADFGIAHAGAATEVPLQGDELQGTMAWMAPEQIDGRWRDQGPWTDLYSLGCMAYFVACGKHPFGTGPAALWGHMSRAMPALADSSPVAAGFEEFLQALTAKEPGDRPQRAADAAAMLAKLGRAQVADNAGWDEAEPTVFMAPLAASPVAAPEPNQIPADWRKHRPKGSAHRLVGAGLGLYGLRSIPLVDREPERDALWDSFRGAWAGETTRVVVLRGPVGCGKSRLAAWICESAHEHGSATVLTAVHHPMAGPTDGVGPMLSSQMRCLGLDRPGVLARVTAALQPDSVPGRQEAAALAELILISEDDEEVQVTFRSPLERHLVVVRHLARLAAERGVLLRLEDVQWGADALGLVSAILDQGVPNLMIVLTVQEEALSEREHESKLLEVLAEHAAVRPVHMGSLPPEFRGVLIQELLGLEGDLAAQVTERTGGNPLFAVQLLDDWVHRGWLVPGAKGFQLKSGVVPRLPDDLAQVGSARIRRLLADRPSQDRVALELAATLGLDVDTGEWRRLCQLARVAGKDGLVEALIERRLASATESGWVFVHGMLREAIVGLARDAGRLEHHHRLCVQMLTATDGTPPAERLAGHLLAAGKLDAAIEPLMTAGAKRVQQGDPDLGLRLYRQVEQTLERLGLGPDDPRHGSQLLQRAEVMRLHRSPAEGRRLLDLVNTNGEGPEWERLRCQVLTVAAQIAVAQGELERGYELAVEGLGIAEAIGDPELMVNARDGVASVCLFSGRLEEAEALARRSLEQAQGPGFTGKRCKILRSLGENLRMTDRLDEAQAVLLEALEGFQKIGYRHGLAWVRNGLGDLVRQRGELALAEEHYRAAIDLFTAIGSTGRTFPWLNLGLVQVERDRFHDARDTFLRCLKDVESRSFNRLIGPLHACLLPCAAGLHSWNDWDRHMRIARDELTRSGQYESDVARMATRAAELAGAARQPRRALAAWRLAHSQWQGLGITERAQAAAAAIDGMV
jgi:tetratricopeptide (TPR) repeat protein